MYIYIHNINAINLLFLLNYHVLALLKHQYFNSECYIIAKSYTAFKIIEIAVNNTTVLMAHYLKNTYTNNSNCVCNTMPVNQLATVNQLNKQLISPALHLIKLKSSMFDV